MKNALQRLTFSSTRFLITLAMDGFGATAAHIVCFEFVEFELSRSEESDSRVVVYARETVQKKPWINNRSSFSYV
jgi:hypothetical protein